MKNYSVLKAFHVKLILFLSPFCNVANIRNVFDLCDIYSGFFVAST
jgi:hypothetical protein